MGEGPPLLAPALLFLPPLFTSQECKSAKPPDLRKREPVEMGQGFKS